MPVRNGTDARFASGCVPVPPGLLRVGERFIDEDEPPDVAVREEFPPPEFTSRGDVRAALLGGVEDFF